MCGASDTRAELKDCQHFRECEPWKPERTSRSVPGGVRVNAKKGRMPTARATNAKDRPWANKFLSHGDAEVGTPEIILRDVQVSREVGRTFPSSRSFVHCPRGGTKNIPLHAAETFVTIIAIHGFPFATEFLGVSLIEDVPYQSNILYLWKFMLKCGIVFGN